MTPPETKGKTEKIFVVRVEPKKLVMKDFKLINNIDTILKNNADKIIDGGIRKVFIENLIFGKQTPKDIKEKGILLPNKIKGNDIYVKKIRIQAGGVKSPIAIKQHHNIIDKNPKDYKQNYYVVNDENYLIALYRGTNSEGKKISKSQTLNLLDAVNNKLKGSSLYQQKLADLDLYKVLKIGQIVILLNSLVILRHLWVKLLKQCPTKRAYKQDAKNANEFMEDMDPKIARKEKAENADIYWGGRDWHK